jgi:hypothetical protein
MLLADMRRQVSAEQEQRAALRIAGLMRTAKKRKPAEPRADNLDWRFTGNHLRSANGQGQQSSSSTEPAQTNHLPSLNVAEPQRLVPQTFAQWPRKRKKFYAVRRGRVTGIFSTWEECERQVKGIYSEFKSFYSLEEAQAYLEARRKNFMLVKKPESSFVGGKALRAVLSVWQDGHTDSLRVICGLDTMSDVNLALAELLHDVHDIVTDDVRGCGGQTAFTSEGLLKVLHEGEVICVPALVATPAQLPRLCDISLRVPGLDLL